MKIQSTKYNRPIHQMWHMMAMTVMLLMLAVTPPIMAQENQRALPDSTLHLPELNAYGQMQPVVSHWPVGYVGMDNWKLHKGMNLMLGASVFTSFGKGWKGAGFSQQVSGMYALPVTEKLSLAIGGYFHNADWAGYNLRQAGFNAVLDYRFSQRWEGFLYGQKTLMGNKIPVPVYDHELGDRIGAAVRYHFNPSTWIQVSLETGHRPYYY